MRGFTKPSTDLPWARRLELMSAKTEASEGEEQLVPSTNSCTPSKMMLKSTPLNATSGNPRPEGLYSPALRVPIPERYVATTVD